MWVNVFRKIDVFHLTDVHLLYNTLATTESERSRLLHFLAVGAGPTGVETMAELSDFVKEDLAKYFPDVGSEGGYL